MEGRKLEEAGMEETGLKGAGMEETGLEEAGMEETESKEARTEGPGSEDTKMERTEAEGKKTGEWNAYFTVEAALVLPVVISSLLFIIYMLFYQYDRCLLEQDMGAMALWGSVEKAEDAAALEEKVNRRMAELYREKYMAWSFTELEAGLEQNRFSVKGGGSLTFPLPGWNFWSGGNVWSTRAEYSYSRLAPVTFIRLCHKFMGDE